MANSKTATQIPQWAINLKARFRELGKTQKAFSEKYGIDQGTVSRNVKGKQEPDPENKNHYVEFLEVPDWNWFLSEDERERLEQEKRAKELFKSTSAYVHETHVNVSQEALDAFARVHKYLLGIYGFDRIEKKLTEQGKINQLGDLCFMLDSIFRNTFINLEPLIEDFLEDYQSVEDKHKNLTTIAEDDLRILELQEIAEQYGFIISGRFDYLHNVNLEFMRTIPLEEKCAAPKEPKKVEHKEKSAPHDEKSSQEREQKE